MTKVVCASNLKSRREVRSKTEKVEQIYQCSRLGKGYVVISNLPYQCRITVMVQ